ncbi:MAG: DUF4139 domain-containing protein [Planctomycetota bacterium]
MRWNRATRASVGVGFVMLWTVGSAGAQAAATGDKLKASRLSLTVYSHADPAKFDPGQHARNRGGSSIFSGGRMETAPGFGVVRDTRTLHLDAGLNSITLTDVAAQIDPTSVALTQIGDDRQPIEMTFGVLDQSFEFDLVSFYSVMDKYVDQPIVVRQSHADGTVDHIAGTLLSADDGLILGTEKGLRVLRGGSDNDIELGQLPQGLRTRPTLIWRLRADEAGPRDVQMRYLTDGMTWRTDYSLVVDDTNTSGELSAWVTLLNLSGASYPDADLKLIAGDVQRLGVERDRGGGGSSLFGDTEDDSFEQKPFGEYHLYTLGRTVTLPDRSTQQITLFPPKPAVRVEKILVYYGLPQRHRGFSPRPNFDSDIRDPSYPKVDVYLRMMNQEDAGLGLPLPAGKVRVFQRDVADGALEFMGEDVIPHTPVGRDASVRIGSSFDVTGQRLQTEFEIDRRSRWMEETIEITLQNAKAEDVEVIVKENLYRWVNWEIIAAQQDHEKIDSRTIHFPVSVPAGGTTKFTYTVKYTW